MALQVDIEKQYDGFALKAAFSTEGEHMALLGASGSGKSLTLKCIAGIEKPDRGRIVLNGRTLFDSAGNIDLPPQQRRAGYLFQDYALFPHMTVEQNIRTGLRRGSRRDDHPTVREYLKRFRLEGLEKRRPAQLSGGEKQRVALARILINEPEVLLLDEPFSALDGFLKWQLELELAESLKNYSGDVLFVSHNRKEVYSLCRSVCILSEGRSERKTETEQLFRSPETVAAAIMTGCSNISRMEAASDGRLWCRDWGIRLCCENVPRDPFGYVGIHASSLVPGMAGGYNVFPMKVEQVVPDLNGVILMLSTSGGGRLRMDLSQAEWEKLGSPGELPVRLPPEALLYLKASGTQK